MGSNAFGGEAEKNKMEFVSFCHVL